MSQAIQREILIASYNRGKEREIAQALLGLPLYLRRLGEFPNIITVEETGKTYAENAALKALTYSQQTGLLSISDDSGLEVDALGGRPGIFSARYAGDDASNEHRIAKLLNELGQTSEEGRTARFVCCIAVAGSEEPTGHAVAEPRVLQISEGTCEGSINFAPIGSNGFGFDPVFVPTGSDRTFAQLPDQIKNVISHRAKAIARMRQFLTRFLSQT